MDPLDRLSMIVNAGNAFDTSGVDITGDNFLVKYDLANDKILWQVNLTALTNGVYGGYQDVTHDSRGNSFVVGTFPSSLIRVTADGQAATWYLKEPADHTIKGFTGLVRLPDDKHLLVADSSNGKLYRFDMTATQGAPECVPITGAVDNLTTMLDGVSIPSRWGGKVILVTDNSAGTHVLYSSDASWKTAEFRGTVPNRLLNTGAFATTTIEIENNVYASYEYFLDEKVNGTLAGDRSQWPLIDITANIEDLLHS